MQKSKVHRAGVLLVGLAFIAASCGDDKAATPAATTPKESAPAVVETTAAAPETTAAAGPETTAVAAPADTKDALVGMKGTTPLVKLSDDFKARLATVPSGKDLKDYNYGPETYDAIVVIALAAEVAKTDGAAMGDEIVGVTKDGTKCTDYAACLKIIKDGGDPDYDGVSGPISMNGNGEPLEASYGVLQFGKGNKIDDSLTTYINAKAPDSAVKPLTKTDVTRAGDGVLKVGGLLPQTGSLAFLGPPEFAGAELAIADINAAGGVLGKPVEYSPGDSGDTSTDTASQTADRLLGEGVDAIIGAASSSVSLTVIDKITAAGVVQFSPANTSLKLVDYPDHSLYFRNAPPDDLQGNVIAQLVIDDGVQSAYILALDDAYGTSLQGVIEAALKAGGVDVVGSKIYDPKATSFDAEVGDVAAKDPDAIILITFDEGSRILKTMVEKGIGPTVKKVYGCDGNIGNALGDNFNAGK
jgi:ABC-type branched-subunit amino acid transport system substrate-binding protein